MPRTRSIPEDVALERSLSVFWATGYDRATVADLCQATGLGPSSIYHAFGSKLELYKRALNHYLAKYAVAAINELTSDRSANDSVRGFLRAIATLCTMPDAPPGCLLMQSAGAGNPENSEANAFTSQIKASLESSIRELLEARQAAGDRLANTPGTLAAFVMATMRGISQLACDGKDEHELTEIADHAANSCIINH